MVRCVAFALLLFAIAPVSAQADRSAEIERLIDELRRGRGLETVATVGSLVGVGPSVVDPMVEMLAPPRSGTRRSPLVRRSFHEPDPELRRQVDRAIQRKLEGGWRALPGPATPKYGFGLVVRSLQRELGIGLGALLLWLVLARRFPRRLDTATVSGLHRLLVPAAPLAGVTWLIAVVIGKPWTMELFSRDDVPAVLAGIVVGGLSFGILVAWASRRPERAEADPPPTPEPDERA